MTELLPLWIFLAALDLALLRATRHAHHVGVSSPAHTSAPAVPSSSEVVGVCPACAPSPPPTADR